jgi:hypothetical protein
VLNFSEIITRAGAAFRGFADAWEQQKLGELVSYLDFRIDGRRPMPIY